jgi:hypothetical protein
MPQKKTTNKKGSKGRDRDLKPRKDTKGGGLGHRIPAKSTSQQGPWPER